MYFININITKHVLSSELESDAIYIMLLLYMDSIYLT